MFVLGSQKLRCVCLFFFCFFLRKNAHYITVNAPVLTKRPIFTINLSNNKTTEENWQNMKQINRIKSRWETWKVGQVQCKQLIENNFKQTINTNMTTFPHNVVFLVHFLMAWVEFLLQIIKCPRLAFSGVLICWLGASFVQYTVASISSAQTNQTNRVKPSEFE